MSRDQWMLSRSVTNACLGSVGIDSYRVAMKAFNLERSSCSLNGSAQE